MLLFGHPHIPSEKLYHIASIEAIEHTPPNSVLLFSCDEQVFELIEFSKTNGLEFALDITTLTQAIICENLDAKYLLVNKSLAKSVQTAADTYLFDAKILVHLEKEVGIEEVASEGIDGAIFPEAIIKIAQLKTLTLLLSLFVLFSGCSRKLPPKKASSVKEVNLKKYSTHQVPKKKTDSSSDLNRLYTQYRVWKGTPYRYGGVSLKGVDCSGFVLNAYKKVYDIQLPRSTKDQVKKGRIVYRYELRTGDLLFFKTGWNVRHVGIYLENGKFMHASNSKGVTIASINNPYWKKHYWQTRRLF